MTNSDLSSGSEKIRDAVSKYFRKRHQVTPKILEPISSDLEWTPSIHFNYDRFSKIAAEVSQTPYPEIFKIIHGDIMNIGEPISIYCICPEELYLDSSNKKEFQNLSRNGYGLITVDIGGQVEVRDFCIPLVLHISDKDYTLRVRGLSGKTRARINDAFDKYKRDARTGVGDLRILFESIVFCAAKRCEKRNFLPNGISSKKVTAILDEMYISQSLSNAKAAVGGVRSFIKDYGNLPHHRPTSRRDAFRTYHNCRIAFLDGIQKIHSFRDVFKNYDISLSPQ